MVRRHRPGCFSNATHCSITWHQFMTIHLETLTADRFDDYLDFVRKIYPQRRYAARRFATQVLKNPFLEDAQRPEILVALDDDAIIGHFGLNPYRFHFHGADYLGYSGFDFYVLEAYRQHGVGKKLAAAAVERLPYLGIGATPVAERIYIKLGAATVGWMYRYFWLRTPLQTAWLAGHTIFKTHWLRKPERVGNFDLPEQIAGDGGVFELRTEADGTEDYPWSDETLSFSRSPEFLQWRYFDHPEHYRFYALKDSQPTRFFVVRRYAWRGLSLLCMVDYRTPGGEARTIDQMLEAVRRLARQGKFDGVVVYSALRSVDDRLTAGGFRKIGQPTIVVLKGDLPMTETRIAGREYVLATLSDCDQDFAVYD